ncbi:MAG: exosortase A [Pacificimonas sp.]|jgi:exosortase A|nr:exosortase A [Pacificimonas sp.]
MATTQPIADEPAASNRPATDNMVKGMLGKLPPPWRTALPAWIGVALAILLLFWRDTADLVGVWWNNSTYQHALLVPPIIAYLVWIRRAELSALVPRPFAPAAILLVIGGIGWLLGELAGVALVRHAALVGMLMVSVPLVLGLTVTRGLIFPLFYALFMIPVGDQLVPWLQMVTADMCILLLNLFNVPAYIDGVFIEIPTGSFEVAEACSGVKFLIAMVAFSTLVAHLCFKSAWKRWTCVISAIVLSIVANGIRAWGTIYIAWMVDPSFARGVDHVVYGWFFFAIIMAIVLGVGWFFFDRPVDDPAFDPDKLQPAERRVRAAPKAFIVSAVVGVAALLVGPAYGRIVADRAADFDVAGLAAPDVPGWRKVSGAGSGWTPQYANASASLTQTYENDVGDRVELFMAAYDRQTRDHELVVFGNGLLELDGDWSWSRNIDGPPRTRAVELQRRPYTRDVWQRFVVAGRQSGSDYAAKLDTLRARLLGGETLAGTVVISVERVASRGTETAALAAFDEALGPVDEALRGAVVPG